MNYGFLPLMGYPSRKYHQGVGGINSLPQRGTLKAIELLLNFTPAGGGEKVKWQKVEG